MLWEVTKLTNTQGEANQHEVKSTERAVWSMESRSSEPQSDGSVHIPSERGHFWNCFLHSWSSRKTRYVRSLPLAKAEESLSNHKLLTSPSVHAV